MTSSELLFAGLDVDDALAGDPQLERLSGTTADDVAEPGLGDDVTDGWPT